MSRNQKCEQSWGHYRQEFRRNRGRSPGLLRYALHKMIWVPRDVDTHCLLHDTLDPAAKPGLLKMLKVLVTVGWKDWREE